VTGLCLQILHVSVHIDNTIMTYCVHRQGTSVITA